MFRKQTILITTSFLLFSIFWIFHTTWMQKSDIARYQNLIREREIASLSAQNPTKQERKNIQKDIWFSQDEHSRLHYKIFSKESLLTLTPVKNRFKLVESLDEVSCWMQDKLISEKNTDNLTQEARLIKAKNGVYHYENQEFVAENVDLFLFELPGHSLPKIPLIKDKAYLTGIAKDVSFLFGGKTPKFQANQFKAKVIQK